MSVTGSGPEPIIFPLLRGMAGRRTTGVAPFRPWRKTPPLNGAWEFPDAFTLPRLPKPIIFAIRAKTNIMRPRGARPLPALGVTITGVSRDSAGAALPGCTCTLFRVTQPSPDAAGVSASPIFTQVATTLSDGSGVYSFVVGFAGPYRVTFDLDGAPIRAGLTLKSLSGI